MTSSHFELDHPKSEAASAFVAEVGQRLQRALLERKEIDKLTQQEIARRLEVDRSRVNKCFSGYANLSLESLAELCWAMDIEPEIAFIQILRDNPNFYKARLPTTHPKFAEATTTPSQEIQPVQATRAVTGSGVSNRFEYSYAE